MCDQKRTQAASGRILGRYAPVDAKVLAKITPDRVCDAISASLRATVDRPLREYKLIRESFSATDLVKYSAVAGVSGLGKRYSTRGPAA